MKLATIFLMLVPTILGCESKRKSSLGPDHTANLESVDVKEESDLANPVFVSFDEFLDAVRSSSSSNAVDCGNLEPEEDTLSANICVGQSFNNEQEFIAISRSYGTDSTEGRAVVSNGSGVVLWYYSSYPMINSATGLSYLGSSIESLECSDANLSGVLEGEFDDVFVCN